MVIRVLRRVIRMLLAKHPKVHIIMADANHDPASQVWLREWLSVLARTTSARDGRYIAFPYNVFEFGKVAPRTTATSAKSRTWREALAAKFREIYGRTGMPMPTWATFTAST